jgi:hypothetical protein
VIDFTLGSLRLLDTMIGWEVSLEDLRDRLETGPEMEMKSESGLVLAILSVQQTLILAYEDNCPLRLGKTGRQSLKGTAKLKSLKRGQRRRFNECRSDSNPYNWDLYKDAQRNYMKEVT